MRPVHHAAPPVLHFHASKEIVALAPVEIVLGIGLIEKGYVNHTAVIHGPELHQVHAPADMAEPGGIGHQALDADVLSVHGGGYGADAAPVLIFSGKKRNKVIERKDAQLVQGQRLFLSYAFQISYIGIKIGHFTR